MAYTKQTWADGVAGGTPVSATRLNYMESGIETAASTADTAATNAANAVPSTQKGAASGVATLDSSGHLTAGQKPSLASTDLGDFAEAVQDIVGAMLLPGTGATVTYNDTAGTVTITVTGGGGSTDPEVVRDTIATALVAADARITITVDDTGDTITVGTTATVNSTDASLRTRSTHTGTEPVSAMPAATVLYAVWSGTGTPVRPTTRTDIRVLWDAPSTLPIVTSPSTGGAYNGDVIVNGSLQYAVGGVWTGSFAPLDSPPFTGTPTAPSPSTVDGIATKGYTDSAILTATALTVRASSTTDKTVTNSATLSTDTDLDVAVGANQVWLFLYELEFSQTSGGGATPRMNAKILVPTGSTARWSTAFDWEQATGTGSTVKGNLSVQTDTLVLAMGDGVRGVALKVRVITGSTTGNVSLQWSQNVATAGISLVRLAGSHVQANRVQ
jgi:hypothetical protein